MEKKFPGMPKAAFPGIFIYECGIHFVLFPEIFHRLLKKHGTFSIQDSDVLRDAAQAV